MNAQEINNMEIEPTIGEMVANDYRKAEVFKRFGIDFCCGGKNPLDKTCNKRGINLEEVKQALKALDEPQQMRLAHDYNNWSIDILSDFIINNHHKYVREALPLLGEYSKKVAKVHGTSNPEVIEIANLFQAVANELRMHMDKEETILFPYIRQMTMAKHFGELLAISPFGSIKNPINMMEEEHESAGGNMQSINELSSGYNPPEWACNTYKVLYAKLQEFENDLHQHVHLENNILFPKAINLEAELLS